MSIAKFPISPRHAVHPVNAILNFGYSVVAGQLHRELAARGLDPACGFLHAPKDGRASLVYDAIELMRADADSRLLGWAASHVWKRADFLIAKAGSSEGSRAGVVRLQPALAKVAAARALAPAADVAAAVDWIVEAVLRAEPGSA